MILTPLETVRRIRLIDDLARGKSAATFIRFANLFVSPEM